MGYEYIGDENTPKAVKPKSIGLKLNGIQIIIPFDITPILIFGNAAVSNGGGYEQFQKHFGTNSEVGGAFGGLIPFFAMPENEMIYNIGFIGGSNNFSVSYAKKQSNTLIWYNQQSADQQCNANNYRYYWCAIGY